MIRQFMYGIAIVGGLLCCSLGYAESINDTIEQVLQTAMAHSDGMQTSNVGIDIISLQTGQTLYQKNSDHLYTPASVQKMITAAAALSYLKPDFRFQTTIYATGPVSQGTLNGNLYVKFSGDPTLSLSDLSQMVDQLRAQHISRINGRVYIDNFDYDDVPYPPGCLWDDLSYSYGAPMNAIIIDRNKFALTFKPASYAGGKPQLSTNLPDGVINFTNELRTTTSYIDNCPITIYSDMHNHYEVSGCLDARSGIQGRSLAIRDMVAYAEVELQNMLQRNQISFTGTIARGHVPQQAVALVVHSSPPLSVILQHTLKKSDNLYINTIFKKLGQMYFSEQGSWQNGLEAVKKILGPAAGIDFTKNLLTDGAGLSRYDLITPRQLTQLLYFIYHDPTVATPLIQALPIAGKDGTLRWRMLPEGSSESIHAKTGSMTGVSALSGFVVTRSHGTVAFAIMANDFVGKRVPYTHLQDHICEALAKS